MSHTQPNDLAPAVHQADHFHPGYQAVHRWFGLSYANYLIMPRAQLQSMPAKATWSRIRYRTTMAAVSFFRSTVLAMSNQRIRRLLPARGAVFRAAQPTK